MVTPASHPKPKPLAPPTAPPKTAGQPDHTVFEIPGGTKNRAIDNSAWVWRCVHLAPSPPPGSVPRNDHYARVKQFRARDDAYYYLGSHILSGECPDYPRSSTHPLRMRANTWPKS